MLRKVTNHLQLPFGISQLCYCVGEELSFYPETEIPAQYLWCSGDLLDEPLGNRCPAPLFGQLPVTLAEGLPAALGILL